MMSSEKRAVRIDVYGLVQGVGYRPFVTELANSLGLSGTVCNRGGIVFITVAGDAHDIKAFTDSLNNSFPRGARIERVDVRDIDVREINNISDGFVISKSISAADEIRFIPADIATCDECERQLFDVGNRRYRYPFISCVSCGPRYTIIKELPYDRERTCMDGFCLCDECERDYAEAGNIRRHAQTIACEKCGPNVRLISNSSNEGILGDEAINKAIELIHKGCIIAVKGIGGYHLCFRADSEEAALRLREYKAREEKPFAVMFRDIEQIKHYARVSETEKNLLISPIRPIVLLDRKDMSEDGVIAPSVCKHSERIGAMLPSNPIQLLLLNKCSPLVMTSANRGGEPIITDDEKMLSQAEYGYIDAVLAHDRAIISGLDDSIYQVVSADGNNHIQLIRRARGVVPEPVELNKVFNGDVFAAGGDLKSVFAFGRKNMAYLSGHFGDLENADAFGARKAQISHLAGLLGVSAETLKTVVTDMHPRYNSVKSVKEDIKGLGSYSPKALATLKIQHHHAHIASVIAEKGLKGRVLGIAFDGTGYGTDGSIWGSEFLVCEGADFIRKGHFSEVKTIGGDVSRDARTTLFSYLYEAQGRGLISENEADEILSYDKENDGADNIKILRTAVDNNINVIKTTSMGRLFDAVSAALRICRINSYEGECPERLQAEAERYLRGEGNIDKVVEDFLSFMGIASFDELIFYEDGVYIADSVRLIAHIIKKYLINSDEEKISGELSTVFHKAVAKITASMADKIASESNIKKIALSGGTMYNRLLVADLISYLTLMGYEVYMNERVPCGDGGLALGQLYLADLQALD